MFCCFDFIKSSILLRYGCDKIKKHRKMNNTYKYKTNILIIIDQLFSLSNFIMHNNEM